MRGAIQLGGNMGIRSTVASLIGGDQVDARLRDIVEGIIAAKGFVRPSDLQELRERIAGLVGGGADEDLAARVSALEADNASLRKRLDLLRGAIDAATAQLADVRRSADAARSDAAKALARAESALATAESLGSALDEAPEAPTDARIDLNAATAEQLELLPGIGPSMAFRIVEDREQNGAFHRVSDLSRVKGMGASTVKKLDQHLRV
jgi:competence ComEA-like helix-hairpin-helix protein